MIFFFINCKGKTFEIDFWMLFCNASNCSAFAVRVLSFFDIFFSYAQRSQTIYELWSQTICTYTITCIHHVHISRKMCFFFFKNNNEAVKLKQESCSKQIEKKNEIKSIHQVWTNKRCERTYEMQTCSEHDTHNIHGIYGWLTGFKLKKKFKKTQKKNREISTIMKNSLRHSHTAHRHWFRHCYEYEYSIKIEKKILETSNPL